MQSRHRFEESFKMRKITSQTTLAKKCLHSSRLGLSTSLHQPRDLKTIGELLGLKHQITKELLSDQRKRTELTTTSEATKTCRRTPFCSSTTRSTPVTWGTLSCSRNFRLRGKLKSTWTMCSTIVLSPTSSSQISSSICWTTNLTTSSRKCSEFTSRRRQYLSKLSAMVTWSPSSMGKIASTSFLITQKIIFWSSIKCLIPFTRSRSAILITNGS